MDASDSLAAHVGSDTADSGFSLSALESKLFLEMRDRHLRSYTNETPFRARFGVDRPSRDLAKTLLPCWDDPLRISRRKRRWTSRNATHR